MMDILVMAITMVITVVDLAETETDTMVEDLDRESVLIMATTGSLANLYHTLVTLIACYTDLAVARVLEREDTITTLMADDKR